MVANLSLEQTIQQSKSLFLIWSILIVFTSIFIWLNTYKTFLSPLITFAIALFYCWIFLVCRLLDIAELRGVNPVTQVWLWQLFPVFGLVIFFYQLTISQSGEKKDKA